MLTSLEWLLLAAVALLLALPVTWTWRMAWAYLRPADPPAPDGDLPPAAVILPLRGADPSLRTCLRGLLAQDYPAYSLRIVVDSVADPAWKMASDILAEERRPDVDVRISVLSRPCATCTLKISAQLQAIEELEDTYAVVALVDADAVPPPGWLRTLVAPLADPAVGAVTGVRWYAPRRPTWGALVRHVWNAGSQPQMVVFGHPWGGTLAVRAHLLRDDRLRAQWQRSFCDDSGLGELLRRERLALRTLPALTMVNQETIGLGDCVRFLRRQLLCPRLDMSNWPYLLAGNVAWLAAMATAAGLAVAGAVLGHGPWLAWFGGLFGLYLLAMLAALAIGERRIRALVRARGQDMPPPAPAWRLVVATLLAQAIHVYCLAAAVAARRVRWRGVDYHIDGPQRIRLVQYRPFHGPARPAESNQSVV